MTLSSAAIREAALALGFCRVGFTPVEPLPEAARALAAWLEADHHGEMAYMAGGPRDDPAAMLAGARTLVVVALAHPGRERPPTPPDCGHIAAYARGADYHQVLKRKLYALADACRAIADTEVMARPCVDSAPLLERGYAARAGVGFTAKNTLAIVPGQGSFVLLGELLLNVAVEFSAPVPPRCGACRRCLDACPTGAFVAPYTLDARRCISYLTIELRGPIPRELRPQVGNMVFGCDICQTVCPFNASPKVRPTAPELAPLPHLEAPLLQELLTLGAAAYRKFVRGTALRRVTRHQLARNAAVALGNSGDLAAVPPLVDALERHPSALVRGHAAWALGRLSHVEWRPKTIGAGGRDGAADGRARDEAATRRRAAQAALEVAELDDADPFVRAEANAARGPAPPR